jgi:hypothetical protein
MSRKIKTIPITIEDVSFIFNDKMDEFYRPLLASTPTRTITKEPTLAWTPTLAFHPLISILQPPPTLVISP